MSENKCKGIPNILTTLFLKVYNMGFMNIIKDFCERLSCKSSCQLGEKALILETNNILDLSEYNLTMKDLRNLNRIVSKRKIEIQDTSKISEI